MGYRLPERRRTQAHPSALWTRTTQRIGLAMGAYFVVILPLMGLLLAHRPTFDRLCLGLVGVLLLTAALFVLVWRLIRKTLWVPLQFLAEYDEVTGLRRPASFWERATYQVATARQTETPLSFVFLDLDNFKAVNDSHGHAVGDAVLAAFGQHLQAAARQTDTVGRLGGEEFGWVLPGALASDAQTATERLLAEWQAQTIAGLRALTFSAGVASLSDCSTDEPSAWDLAQLADRALYQAKASGRAQVALASGH